MIEQNKMIETVYQLTFAGAEEITKIAVTEAYRMGVSVCIAVVDRAGHLITFVRMDGAHLTAEKTAIAKAKSAVLIQKETGILPFELGLQIALANVGDFTNLQGGFPVLHEGQIIGGIGIGSATVEEDISIARLAANGLNDV